MLSRSATRNTRWSISRIRIIVYEAGGYGLFTSPAVQGHCNSRNAPMRNNCLIRVLAASLYFHVRMVIRNHDSGVLWTLQPATGSDTCPALQSAVRKRNMLRGAMPGSADAGPDGRRRPGARKEQDRFSHRFVCWRDRSDSSPARTRALCDTLAQPALIVLDVATMGGPLELLMA